MIRAGAGLSRIPSAERAAQQAGEAALQNGNLDSADLLIVFATSHHSHEYPKLLSTLSSLTGADNLIGCSGLGVLTSEGEIEGSISLAVLAIKGIQAAPFLVKGKGKEPQEVISDTISKVDPKITPGATLLLLADPLNIDLLSLVDVLQDRYPDVTMVGSAASTMSLPPKTYQFFGKEVTDSGVAGVVFTKDIHSMVGVAQGCKPIGKPYVVTKARDNIIFEIGNLPATEVLRQALESLSPEESKYASGSIFAGILADERKYPPEQGDFLIRHFVGVDERYQAIAIGGRVATGQTLQFQLRETQAARTGLLNTLSKLSEGTSSSKAAFGLYFNCLGRGQGLYGIRDHDSGVISGFFPDVPIAGLFGNAEIGPIQGRNAVHNYSGVLALFREAEGSKQ